MNKIRVGILFGGKSAEHEVSLRSAKSIVESLDNERFEPVLIGIDKQGVWHHAETSHFLGAKSLQLDTASQEVALIPSSPNQELVRAEDNHPLGHLDVIFPILHGPMGEDGTIQGLLKLANIPFVGADVLGSAVGMDKDVMKRLLRDANLPIGKFLTVTAPDQVSFTEATEKLGTPLFIKPANMGSSVGVNKATNETEFKEALTEAFEFDTKVLIEEFIEGTEVECAVLGNEKPEASLPGRIIPQQEFYSYNAKYIDENGAVFEIPAQLPQAQIKEAQELAVQSFQALCCAGLARVDMFLTPSGKLVLNEINTLPGFTSISMYPKLWEASGLSRKDLVTRLIELALEHHQKQEKLKTSYS